MLKIRQIIREAITVAMRNDDYDILRRDQRAFSLLRREFRDADDSPADYEWHITANGYRGKGKAVDAYDQTIENEYTSLEWNGSEWLVGDWKWD